MDRTSIIAIIVCVILIGLWTFVFIPRLSPPPTANTNQPPITLTGTNQPGVTSPPTAGPAPQQPAAPVAVIKTAANTNLPEDLIEITNANAHYTFTSHGGGLKQIELLKYPETVPRNRKDTANSNRVATLNSFTPAPTLALLGDDTVQGDGI